jgi:hypothetical protein
MLSHIKIKNLKKYIAYRIVGVSFILFIIAFSSCLGIRTHVKGIEPTARPLSTGKYDIIEPVEFSISSFKLFWIIPVTPDLKIYETIDETVTNKGGDNLIDMQLWHERQYWILGTIDIIHVKGKIIRTAD